MPDTLSAGPIASVAACATAAGLAYALKRRPYSNGHAHDAGLGDYSAELAKMRAEMDNLRHGQERAQAQLAALQAELDETAMRADRAEAEMERACLATREMQAELTTKDEEMASLAAELETARAELKFAQSQREASAGSRQYDGSFYPRTEGAMSYYPCSTDGDRSVLSGFSPQSPDKQRNKGPRGQLTPMDKKWEGAMLRTSLFMPPGKASKAREAEPARRELAF